MQSLGSTHDSRLIAVQRQRRPSRAGTCAPAEVPRRKGAEGRHQLASFFCLSRLLGAGWGRGADEVGGARGLVVDAGEVPRGRRVRLVELNVAAAAVAVVQLVGEVEELGRVDDDVDGRVVPLWLCQPDVELVIDARLAGVPGPHEEIDVAVKVRPRLAADAAEADRLA